MGARILVIDDDKQVRLLIRRMLESGGYTVEEATDGDEGMKMYMREPHDLVITDLIMPDKEGLETIRDLRRFNPDIKIIAISGGGSLPANNYLRMAESFGAQRTLNKPFRTEDILDSVRELLS